MHLKEIEILGFKTFAEKTSIEFKPAQKITAIVGPNGCGKSNLVDSFRWVMGEQSIRLLRGSAHDEIIFTGSDSAKPLSLAEVRLTFDNSDHYLKVDFSEVAVKRRVYRSGESEFYINKSACRLKDIQKLFLDTGIGRNSYAIVNQGQIDAILNAKPEERRAIFEEVAGINKYRTQKNETLNKLAATEVNLIRVTDLCGEIRNQMGPLKIQAEKAQRYKTARSELEKIEVNLICAELLRANQKKEKNEDIVKEARGKLLEIEKKIKELEAEKNNLGGENLVLDERLSAQRRGLVDLRSEIEKTRAAVTINQERQGYLEERQKQLTDELASLQKEHLELSARLEKTQRLAGSEAGALSGAAQQADLLKKAVAENSRQLLELEDDIEQQSALIMELEREQSHTRNILADLDSSKKIIERELVRDTQEKTDLTARAEELKRKIESRKETFSLLESELQQIQKQLFSDRAAEEQLLVQKNELEERIRALRDEISRAASRVQLLMEMQANYEGFGTTVKSVLQAFGQGRLSGQIQGVLGELIQVPREYRQAVEAVLSEKLNFLVVADEATFQAVRSFVKEHKLSEKIGFFILSLLEKNAYKNSVAVSSGFSSLADFVTAPGEILNLVRQILSDFMIVDNLEQAWEVVKKGIFKKARIQGLVTLAGEIIWPQGELALGKPRDTFEIFTRSEQIRELQTAENLLKEQLQKLLAELNSTSAQIELARETIREKEISFKVHQLKMASTAEDRDRWQEDLFELQKELEIIEKNQAIRQGELQALAQQQAEAVKKIGLLEKQNEQIKNESISRHQSQVKLKEIQNDKVAELNQLNIGLARQAGQAAQIKEQQDSLEATGQRLASQIKDRTAEQRAGQIKIEELRNQRGELSRKMPLLLEKEAGLLAVEKTFETNRLETQTRLRDIEKNIQKNQESRYVLESDVNEVKIRLAEIEVIGETLSDRLLNDYEINADEVNLKDFLVEDFTEVKGQVEKLRREIHRLEPVNLLAIEELNSLEERLKFLESQKADLVSAKDNLTSLIRQLDTAAKQDLLESIAQVNTHFSRIFSKIFSGGASSLVAVDADDILNSGIEIMVQMPGKRRQNLTLLSGGERALTSAALLFAMLEARPAPFCVLDEVDAPLDENNVDRFIELLREFSQKSQILIITHNRRTIAAADVIYGVTMETAGISKIISLKLSKVEEVLGK